MQAVATSVWETWFRDDLSVQDRLVYKTRTLAIESLVDPTDQRHELHLFCAEVQA